MKLFSTKVMTSENQDKFLLNIFKFTAPALAVFFGQLALGADWKTAGLVALYTLYALASDYFSKVK